MYIQCIDPFLFDLRPGYGFLSENASFVKALDNIGVTFIGPSEDAMAAMGDKIQSKIIAKESKVNIIPGFNGVVRDVDHALEICKCLLNDEGREREMTMTYIYRFLS